MGTLNKIGLSVFVSVLFLALSVSAYAQCKSVVKDGIKKLSPYTHNGQVNNVTVKEGKPAEIHLSFYKGLYYKLQISSEESLGKVNFRVLDENKKEVYNSTTDGKSDFWNFYSNSSQDLIVEVIPSEKVKKGCVAVLVGMQVPKSNNPIRNL
ncbi:MAG: hypothetical protein V4608_00900 [Bacteroidota bacterium]